MMPLLRVASACPEHARFFLPAPALPCMQGELVFDTSAADGQYKKTASNKKLRGLLPDFKFTPLSKGIKQTVDWFVANHEAARK